MGHKVIQSIGLGWTVLYAILIVWIYATEPRTFSEVATGARVATGSYEVNQPLFDDGLALFHRGQFRAAREEWQRADPAQRDARTQFYLAYALYREGWGRVYNDQELFGEGLAAVNRSIDLAAGSSLNVDDADLQMHTPLELKVELQEGTERTWSNLNPLRLVRTRK